VTGGQEVARMTGRPKRRSVVGRAALTVITFGIIAVVIFPVYWMVISSLQSGGRFSAPSLIPRSLTVDPIVTVMRTKPVLQWFGNSSIVAVSTAVICSVISLNAGYALARFRSRVSTLYGIAILFTQMLPATLLVVPLFIVMKNLAMLNSLTSLVVANTAFALPLSIWLMKGFVESLPPDLEQQAMVDGCSRLGAYVRIALPLLRPGVMVVVVFSFLLAWNDFFFARSLIVSQDRWVLSVGLTSFTTEYTVKWPELMSAATLFAVPAVLFFALMQRNLVGGLTAGSVKG